MPQNRITLHLADSQATLRPAPTRRLVRPLLPLTLPTRVPLVLRHMLQTHRIDIANKHLGRNHLSAHTIVHELLAKRLHPEHITQNAANRLHRIPVIHKEGSIAYCSQWRRRLAHERLHQLRHRHTRRNRMRIHNHIYRDSLSRAGHVVAAQKHADCSLLAVPV